jgi:hypothetical protein
VGVTVGGSGVTVGGKGGTNNAKPAGGDLIGRQLPALSSSTVAPKATARLSQESSGWIVIGNHPAGIEQLAGVGAIGVAVGSAVGLGVKVGSPGSWVGIMAEVLVMVGAIASLAPPSVNETARLPKIIAAEISAARMPNMAWRDSLMFLPILAIRRLERTGAWQDHAERRALARAAIHPNPATQPLDHDLGSKKAPWVF